MLRRQSNKNMTIKQLTNSKPCCYILLTQLGSIKHYILPKQVIQELHNIFNCRGECLNKTWRWSVSRDAKWWWRRWGPEAAHYSAPHRPSVAVRITDRQGRLQDQGDQGSDRGQHTGGQRHAAEQHGESRHHHRHQRRHHTVYLPHLLRHAGGQYHAHATFKQSILGFKQIKNIL